MIEIALFIEGQNGLTWPRWQAIAQAVEDLGFAGLYRSDHYTNRNPPDLDSLECWVSLAWLASHTRRIEFGPLVSPVSFRHPTLLARMAAALDDLSGGRFVLGVGAGWQEREHKNYGWDLLEPPQRFNRLVEGVEVISLLLNSRVPIDYQGEYFKLQDAILLPPPQRPAGPPVLIGGNGSQRTLRLAARLADEWNAFMITAAEYARLNARLDELLLLEERQPAEVRRSIMLSCVYGNDRREVEQKVAARTNNQRTIADLRAHGVLVGTGPEIRQQITEYEQAGAQRVMLQWLELEKLNELISLAQHILR
jgi:F420-dependent oxidoreductase-like protein